MTHLAVVWGCFKQGRHMAKTKNTAKSSAKSSVKSPAKNMSKNEDGLSLTDIGLEDGRQSDAALAIQRGTIRLLSQYNIACLPEVVLPNHRRADLMALTDKGEIWIIEIKSGLPDFQADDKWPDYLPYCDRFYFAVAPDFPSEKLPENAGMIFADNYGAEIMRENEQASLAPARRNLLLRRMARIGGFRWSRLRDKASS
jgi:hypothetical protein